MLLLFALGLCAPLPARADEPPGWGQVEASGIVLHRALSDSVLGRHVLGELVSARRLVAQRLGLVSRPPAPGGGAGERGSGGDRPSLVSAMPVQVYLATTEAAFRDLTRGRIPHWGAGVAFPQAGTVVLRYRPGQTDELFQTVRHELSHLLLFSAVSADSSLPSLRVPVWFNEGVAMWCSGEWRFDESAEVALAVASGSLLPLGGIDAVLEFASPKARLAYTLSYLAVLFLIDAGGPSAVPDVVEAMAAGAPFDVALYRVSGLTPRAFETAFREHVQRRFGLRGVLLSPEAVWVYMLLVVGGVWGAVRARNRATLRRWEAEDPFEALPPRLRLEVRRRRCRR